MKKLSLLLAALLILGTCAIPALAEEKAELNFWYWDISMDQAYTDMFAAFTEANPNITVKMTQIPWADYWTKLQTALPSGAGPDIFWLNHPNAVTYLPTGLVQDLEAGKADGSIDMSKFAESLYTPYTKEGKLYCVPIFFDTLAIGYNKAMMADAGYPDGPPADWNWDTFKEIAQKLTKDGVYGFAATSAGQECTMDWIAQNGSNIYAEDGLSANLTDPKVVEAIQYLRDLMAEGISPQMKDYVDVVMLDTFTNEMAAMMPFGLWNVKPAYELMGDNLGLAPMPQGTQKATISHNLGYALSAKCANMEAGMKLMSYFTTKDHGDRVAAVFAPAHQDSQQLWFDTYPTLNLNVFTDGLEYAVGLMISSKNAGQTFSLYEAEMQKLFEDPSIPTEEGLAAINALLDAEIAK